MGMQRPGRGRMLQHACRALPLLVLLRAQMQSWANQLTLAGLEPAIFGSEDPGPLEMLQLGISH